MPIACVPCTVKTTAGLMLTIKPTDVDLVADTPIPCRSTKTVSSLEIFTIYRSVSIRRRTPIRNGGSRSNGTRHSSGLGDFGLGDFGLGDFGLGDLGKPVRHIHVSFRAADVSHDPLRRGTAPVGVAIPGV